MLFIVRLQDGMFKIAPNQLNLIPLSTRDRWCWTKLEIIAGNNRFLFYRLLIDFQASS